MRVHRAKDKEVHKDQLVRVIIRPPIDAPGYGRGRADELVRAVRESIIEGLRLSGADPDDLNRQAAEAAKKA